MSNEVIVFPVPAVTPPALPVSLVDQTKGGVTFTQNGTTVVVTDSSVPPPATVKISPTGGVDNVNWITLMQSAIKQNIPAELLPGTYKLNPFVFDGSLNGLQLIIDAGVTWTDASIFGQFQCMITIAGGFNGTIVGNSTVITMPINNANAIKQVANGLDFEYQHALSFNGCNGTVTISGLHINLAAGDGVNFDVITSAAKVTLTNIVSSNSLRQGWSVTGKCANVTINNCSASTNAHTGFDFEPDNAGDSVTGFVINNFTTTKNSGGGMSFGFMNLRAGDTVDVTVNGMTSISDNQTGIGFWNNNSPTVKDDKGLLGNASGKVTVNNYSVQNSQYDGTYGRKANDGWTMVFATGVINGSNQGGKDPHYGTDSALGVAIFGGETGTPGGVQWNAVTITGGSSAMDLNGVAGVVVKGTYNGAPISFP